LFVRSTLTMTLLIPIYFTATKRTNRIDESLLPLRIPMSPERKFQLLLAQGLSSLSRLRVPVATTLFRRRPPCLHLLLQFPVLKSMKIPLQSSEFWQLPDMPLWRSSWLLAIRIPPRLLCRMVQSCFYFEWYRISFCYEWNQGCCYYQGFQVCEWFEWIQSF